MKVKVSTEEIVNFLKAHAEPALSQFVSAAIKKLESLSEDEKMLDWLADRDNQLGQISLPTGAVMENLDSMRKAIKATMEGSYSKRPPATETHASEKPKETRISMPKELTAENGAKGLLMGEFFEEVEIGGEGEFVRVPVSWTTIKEIYKMAAKNLSKEIGDE